MSYSSRLCRLMCGGACPTEHDPSNSGLRPVFWGIAPTHFVARRKVRDLPHIRRRSRTHGINPNSFPICTAWVRRRALRLSNRRLEWVLTVFSLTKSFSAISRLLRPLAISSRISSSRSNAQWRHETEMSDAHARTYRPDRHHARLAVNAANTLVDFLLESYTLRQRKDAKDLATKVTDHLSV